MMIFGTPVFAKGIIFQKSQNGTVFRFFCNFCKYALIYLNLREKNLVEYRRPFKGGHVNDEKADEQTESNEPK